MTSAEIDMAEAAILDLLKVGAVFYPPLAPAIPLISGILKFQTTVIRNGLADGSIVPDGAGGLVPITNSHYDPKTGRFL
jgi:hypothetical protein